MHRVARPITISHLCASFQIIPLNHKQAIWRHRQKRHAQATRLHNKHCALSSPVEAWAPRWAAGPLGRRLEAHGIGKSGWWIFASSCRFEILEAPHWFLLLSIAPCCAYETGVS
ncbi:hypothetical protein SNOG_01911 [Parastagonospora nodorum SN15]|uniref:Uncharacterized protein n=1 Tax=Phaeosphaeria nodorum (strain SN15 / ATCC MYA-4574 / FGSC 10173) TaxID=321614 RepID=Q0V253_PHANO|nr:hypothetical protein SNOG_01911 [Parastagonospora nodorum SN15]EAT90123.2 hypothetical protein SNOG_01911 [Parastagonospora nodorum SN15]